MAVNNNIAPRQIDESRVVEFKVGEELVKLSPAIVRNYLVSGDGNITDQELTMFINLCRYQHLNPFLREAYIIKYGSQPATIVTGKDAIEKRAMRNPNYQGVQAGVIIYNPETKELENRIGALVIQGEHLVGGWAKVYVKGYSVPIETAVSFQEYAGRKRDGSLNNQWATKPATMIRKVAKVQALREAFPEDLGSMYAAEEVAGEFHEEIIEPPAVTMEVQEQQPIDPPFYEEPEQQSMSELADF